MPRPSRSETSQGHLPASCRHAVPTREYQCGGQPIHCVPARRATPRAARSPPPARESQPIRVLMRLSVQASLRLNHAIHQGNHRLDRPLHISTAAGNVRPVLRNAFGGRRPVVDAVAVYSDGDAAALYDLLNPWDPARYPSDAVYHDLVMAPTPSWTWAVGFETCHPQARAWEDW